MPKAFHAKKHLERSQPEARKKFGLLEKKKDYKLRAKNYAKKKETLSILAKKAQLKNEDEFYHGMIRSQINKDGELVKDRTQQFSGDLIKLLKSQDVKYIQYYRQVNIKEMKKLEDEIALKRSLKSEGKHTIFGKSVSDRTTQKDSTVNRPESEETQTLLRHLELRKKRDEALWKVEQEMQLQKTLLTSKGKRNPIGKDGRGNNIYKWRNERQK
ncbi:hypothetical protein MP638_001237 [Amoeboaphelidium occidentale]|nr:hypothetical protein MP638_001237 [Amoeboaphelidium occidentale]